MQFKDILRRRITIIQTILIGKIEWKIVQEKIVKHKVTKFGMRRAAMKVIKNVKIR